MKIVELQKVVGNSEIRLESDFWIKEKVQFKSVKGADVEEGTLVGKYVFLHNEHAKITENTTTKPVRMTFAEAIPFSASDSSVAANCVNPIPLSTIKQPPKCEFAYIDIIL